MSVHGSSGLLVSFIVPIWNTSETSLLNMRRRWGAVAANDIEIVLVDDASSNSSTRTALHEFSMDTSVRYLRMSENHGPGAARNAGIDVARGDWLVFVDSDDAQDFDVFVRGCRGFNSGSVEVLSFNYRWQPASGRRRLMTSPDGESSLLAATARRPAVWRFAFRRSLLGDSIRFPELRYGEDLLFLMKIAQYEPTTISVGGEPAVTYVQPPAKRDYQASDRFRLLEELLLLRNSNVEKSHRGALDSWILRVCLHARSVSAVKAALSHLRSAPPGLAELESAIRYTTAAVARRR